MRLKHWHTALVAMFVVGMATTNLRADYAAAITADQPVGYWRFGANQSVVPNLGTGGAALDGQVIGGQMVTTGTYQVVDGRTIGGLGANNVAFEVGTDVDQYMSVEGSILNDLGEFTLEGWVNPGPRASGRIGLFGQNDAVEFGFISPNVIQLWTPSGKVLNYAIDPVNQIPEDTWVHLAAVANGDSIRLFINGVPQSKGASYGDGTFNFNIAGGGVFDATGNQFTGSVDSVGIWNKALTAAEVQAQYNAGVIAGSGYDAKVMSQQPLGYWNLNDPNAIVINLGSGGAALNGEYVGGDRSVSGPTLPGFSPSNAGFGGTAPDDGYITVPNAPLKGLGQFTVSGWVKPGEIVNNRVGLFGQNDTVEFGLINPTTLQIWTPNGGSVDVDVSTYVGSDEWMHVAAVGTGEQIEVYIDGEQVGVGGTSLIGNPVDSHGASTYFFNVGGGGIYDTTGNQFVGQLDEIAVYDRALSDAQILAHFQAALGTNTAKGDFNQNGQLDAGDLDLLAAAMVQGNPQFDLNGDQATTIEDRQEWVNVLKHTYMGDANLDGQFNSDDLVVVFIAGRFETGAAATWEEGDWDGNQVFDSSDFVEAFQGGGYEAGPRAATAAVVPEPTSLAALTLAGLLIIAGRRHR